MKLLIALAVLFVAGSADAWWGYGGWGGYGMYGMYGMYGYGYPYYGGWWGKRAAEEPVPLATESLKNRTECVFIRDSTMLSCRGLTGVVECETKAIKPEGESKLPFELYGLSRSEGFWKIMPRKPDNTQWLDNVFLFNETRFTAELYWSAEESTRYGLRVVDEKCYQKMDELLQASLRNERVYYSKITGEQDIAAVRADLIVTAAPEVDLTTKEGKETLKRWWGGFYGGWYSPYSFGYGYGYPYYYYGKRSDGPTIELKRDSDFKREDGLKRGEEFKREEELKREEERKREHEFVSVRGERSFDREEAKRLSIKGYSTNKYGGYSKGGYTMAYGYGDNKYGSYGPYNRNYGSFYYY